MRKALGEQQVQKALRDHLRPGMTFYDLGANIGFFSLIAAQLVGPSGCVISFEADPEIAARQRENLAFNKFANTGVEQMAVWSSAGRVPFKCVDSSISPDRGLGHVAPGCTDDPHCILVVAIALNDYTTCHQAPDFIKCDVEGAEMAVFLGAGRLLAGKRPILLVEMHSEENRRYFGQHFIGLGYELRDLDQNHVLALPR